MMEIIRELLEGLTSPYYVSQILPYHLAMFAFIAAAIMKMGDGRRSASVKPARSSAAKSARGRMEKMPRRSLVTLEEKCRKAKDKTRQKKLEYQRDYYRKNRDRINEKRSGHRHLSIEELRRMHEEW